MCIDMTDEDDFAMNLGIPVKGLMDVTLNRWVKGERLGGMGGPTHTILVVEERVSGSVCGLAHIDCAKRHRLLGAPCDFQSLARVRVGPLCAQSC